MCNAWYAIAAWLSRITVSYSPSRRQGPRSRRRLSRSTSRSVSTNARSAAVSSRPSERSKKTGDRALDGLVRVKLPALRRLIPDPRECPLGYGARRGALLAHEQRLLCQLADARAPVAQFQPSARRDADDLVVKKRLAGHAIRERSIAGEAELDLTVRDASRDARA